MSVRVNVTRDPEFDPDIPLPSYATAGAAGADIRANLPGRHSITLPAGGRVLIPTGLRFEIPQGYEIQLRPRSGLALKHGITLVNAPGTIDSDYRGLVGVILLNTSDQPFDITHGERIAQMVLAPVVQGIFTLCESLQDSARAEGGFGSTGRK